MRNNKKYRFGLAVALAILAAAPSIAQTTSTPSAKKIQFNRDIRPILSDKCFACHGPDAAHVAADLRLDQSETAIDHGAIVPGDSEASELVNRIFSDDDDTVMPPPELHKPLTDNERQRLKRWIDQGATYERHWAYTNPTAAPDSIKENIVDHFVDAAITNSGMTAVEQADRATLIRRLSLDLNGLPPTIEEVTAFENDESPDAYAKLVDRMLSSPRYGERMAGYWLDLVRYADTVGYHGDQDVSQWPYRDYVIKAFNNNMPYDQFIREQLAGDLLPHPTLEQKIASGYNRLNQTTEEGGSQAKEYLAIYFADRVRNVSQVFMGSTLGCAQCHDHKYDPFTAKDFYAFGAFFADIKERGVYSARRREPALKIPTSDESIRIKELSTAIQNAKSTEKKLQVQLEKEADQWQPTNQSNTIPLVDDSKPAAKTYSGDWNFSPVPDVTPTSGERYRQQTAKGLVQHFALGLAQPLKVTAGTTFTTWVYLDANNPPRAIMLQVNDGKSWDHRAVWGGDEISYGKRAKSWAGYQRMGELPELGKWVKLQFNAKLIGLSPSAGSPVAGIAFTQFGGRVLWDKTEATQSTPKDVVLAAAAPSAKRTAQQTKTLREFYLSQSEELAAAKSETARLQQTLESVERTIATTVVTESVKPREIRILPRGNWMDDSGPVVQPAIPEFLGKLPTGQRRPTRLDLANWLSQPDNPLTARTMVNRLWSRLFGRGICTSVDDFGGQGTYPSNPELLDALAVEFVASDWNVKHLIRLIVTSEAYQRSSRPTAELRDKDPYNDLFARQGRFRVDAEIVRDTALYTSGLLVEKIGGKSAKPYQPIGYYAELNFPTRTYQADKDANQFRRGLYTHWQRTFLHPMMKAFDAPSREECTAQRARSSTPLQALTLMNDPTFIEAARALASRTLREGGANRQSRIQWAYQTVTSHPPEPEIIEALADVFDQHSAIYQADPEAAKQLLKTGISKTQNDLDPIELAAWTGVARTLLNLHETTMRY